MKLRGMKLPDPFLPPGTSDADFSEGVERGKQSAYSPRLHLYRPQVKLVPCPRCNGDYWPKGQMYKCTNCLNGRVGIEVEDEQENA